MLQSIQIRRKQTIIIVVDVYNDKNNCWIINSKGAEKNPHLFLERAGDLEPGGTDLIRTGRNNRFRAVADWQS